jgi:hypothetical protein
MLEYWNAGFKAKNLSCRKNLSNSLSYIILRY